MKEEKHDVAQEQEVNQQAHQEQSMIVGIIDNVKQLGHNEKNNNHTNQDNPNEIILKEGAIFKVHNKNYCKNSIFCFGNKNKMRQSLVWLIEWKWFDVGIISLIFLNSIFMAFTDFLDRDNKTFHNQVIEKAGQLFSIIFTFEAAFKIISMGFIIPPKAYLRDGWNWIDFIVVVIGIVEAIPGIPNMKALRTLRVLRPLRSINAVPSMRRLITSLILSLPALANVILFLMFMFILFGILGVQQYAGAFYNRCRLTEKPISDGTWPIDPEITRICSSDNSGLFKCPEDRWCGNPLDYGISLETENVHNQEEIFYGIVTFDNIGIGMITIFQIITLEGWTDMMYDLMDHSQTVFSAIFFNLIVMIGSFFMLQLILAVIMDTFNSFDREQEEQMREAIIELLEERKITEEQKQKKYEANEINIETNNKGNEEDDNYSRSNNNSFYRVFYKLCTHPLFGGFIIFLILANTFVLSLDKYPIDSDYFHTLEKINMTLSWLFFAEMVIKLIGLGFKEYSRDKFNLFDCLIVIMSTIEMILEWVNPGDSSGGGAISAFRGVRLLRVFKLARSWKSFQEILFKIMSSLKDISNFSVLLSLFIFIYALLGMELFAYRVKYNDDNIFDLNGSSPRTNFDTFSQSLVSIFIVLIGEDWNSVMYSHQRAVGNTALIFFVSLMILGNLVLLNLFLAILLKNFEQEVIFDDEPSDLPSISIFIRAKNKMCSCCKKKNQEIPLQKIDLQQIEQDESLLQTPQNLTNNLSNNISNERSNERLNSPFLQIHNRAGDNTTMNIIGEYQNFGSVTFEQNICPSNEQGVEQIVAYTEPSPCLKRKASVRQNTIQMMIEEQIIIKNMKNSDKLFGNSFWIMKPDNSFRLYCQKICNLKYFDTFILIMIVISTILLTLENPLDDPNGKLLGVLFKIDIVITTIFTLEMLIKMFMVGFMFCGQSSYIRNSWNILDFVIVVFSIISLSMPDFTLKFIKVLRMLRVLRPLRMISRNEGLKVAVLSLINAVPGILNVLVISFLFFLLFGIFGVTYFKGTFFSCQMDSIPISLQSNIINSFECMNNGGVWVNTDANFDNITSAVLTLFEMSSTEGWIDVMWSGVDKVGINQQPIQDNDYIWVLFFIMFLIVGFLFVVNLFVGVVINTFNGEKEKLGKNYILTESQREWIQIQLLCFQTKPIQNFRFTGNKCKDFFLRIATNSYFDGFIIFCIISNTIVLALKWYDEPESLPIALDKINLLFALIFTFEAIIKISGLRKKYFKDSWNLFDFTIVIGTFIGICMENFFGINVGAQTTLIRAFRIGRIFRLVKKAKSLRMIFNTFVITIPSLANVGGLLMLLLYIYAVLGVFLFAQIQLQDTLDVHANFQSFGNAFLTLIRAATGEAWNYIMKDCSRQHSILFQCVSEPSYEGIQQNGGNPNGCGSAIAIPFFVSFLLIVTMVFLNLFIAIILEGFGNTSEAENLRIPDSTIDGFRNTWSEFDYNGDGFIDVNLLSNLILRLAQKKEPILNFHCIFFYENYRNKFMRQLKIPCYKNFTQYHYIDILNALCKQNFSISFLKDKRDKSKILHTLTVKDKEEAVQDEFENVLDLIDKKCEDDKISVMESFKKVAMKHAKKHKGNIDTFQESYFDSAHIVLVPYVQKQARLFLLRMKEKRQENLSDWDETMEPPQQEHLPDIHQKKQGLSIENDLDFIKDDFEQSKMGLIKEENESVYSKSYDTQKIGQALKTYPDIGKSDQVMSRTPLGGNSGKKTEEIYRSFGNKQIEPDIEELRNFYKQSQDITNIMEMDVDQYNSQDDKIFKLLKEDTEENEASYIIKGQ